MSTSDFEQLGKLLACKRYEAPPPGYFNRFSDGILARLEQEQKHPGKPWWERFLERFDFQPALATVYGAVVCTLLLSGIRFAADDAGASASLFESSSLPENISASASMDSSFSPGRQISSTVPHTAALFTTPTRRGIDSIPGVSFISYPGRGAVESAWWGFR